MSVRSRIRRMMSREHRDVARVAAVLVAGVNMDDRRAGLTAQPGVLGDFLRRDRDVRAVAAHLHAAVDGGDDHQRLCHGNLLVELD